MGSFRLGSSRTIDDSILPSDSRCHSAGDLGREDDLRDCSWQPGRDGPWVSPLGREFGVPGRLPHQREPDLIRPGFVRLLQDFRVHDHHRLSAMPGENRLVLAFSECQRPTGTIKKDDQACHVKGAQVVRVRGCYRSPFAIRTSYHWYAALMPSIADRPPLIAGSTLATRATGCPGVSGGVTPWPGTPSGARSSAVRD